LALSTLWACWGGEDAVRPSDLDYELARLAILGNQIDILRLTAQSALKGLTDAFRYPEAAALAQQALQTLDHHAVPVTLSLLRTAGDCCERVGERQVAQGYYERALALLKQAAPPTTSDERDEQAMLLDMYGRLLWGLGQPDKAQRVFDAALELLGSDVHFQWRRAVIRGGIADILVSRGQLDEALRIREEEELPVYERLGDVRERAVVLFKMAKIYLQQEDYQSAFEHLVDSYQMALDLGNLEIIVYVGIDLGQWLYAADHKEQGLTILKRSYEGLLQLGREDEASRLQELIAQAERDQP
jgi:tetratricopeptide (TPR) repeat protein